MIRDIFFRIVQLITAPEKAWRTLFSEENELDYFLSRFLHPIFGFIALTSFIGGLWFTSEGNVQLALKNTIANVVAVFGGYFIASFFLNELAPRYGLIKNMPFFQQFVGYSSVALYAIYFIIPFIPYFFILWILAIYTLYIVYVGAPIYLRITEDQRMNFTIIATLFIVLSPLVLNGILSFIIH